MEKNGKMTGTAAGSSAGRLCPRREGEPEISVVMPCLNEEATVAACVEEAMDFFRQMSLSGEVVVVDNGSTDGSANAAERSGARVVRAPRRGYGAALRAGFAGARGRATATRPMISGICGGSMNRSLRELLTWSSATASPAGSKRARCPSRTRSASAFCRPSADLLQRQISAIFTADCGGLRGRRPACPSGRPGWNSRRR